MFIDLKYDERCLRTWVFILISIKIIINDDINM